MTRRRIAVALLVVLAWCTAGPWAYLEVAPAGGAVIAAGERPDQGPALLSRATASETLAHLPRHSLDGALAIQAPRARTIAASARRPAPVPPRQPQRRTLARRISRAPDEPS